MTHATYQIAGASSALSIPEHFALRESASYGARPDRPAHTRRLYFDTHERRYVGIAAIGSEIIATAYGPTRFDASDALSDHLQGYFRALRFADAA